MKNCTSHIINSSLTDLLNAMSNQTKTNIFATLALSVFPLIFTACGEETTENITQINQTDIEVVSSTKELPKCTKDNVGQQAFVKGESSTLICVDNKWVATTSSGKDTVIIKEASNCTTKELKDKSGVKIVCGGDSVGVVLNGKQGEKGDPGTAGKQGEKGDAGTGCTIAQDTSKITITCGDKSSTINLNDIGTSIADTAVVDSEKVAVSLDSLTGYTQKGPFIKGSTVYLYELMDGRTLKQTNGSFTSNITRDDGRFKFTARDLVSQYVMLVVDGNYRNEVTGKTSNSAIRLKAYSDVRRHATGTVNVNILTHLEFDRVYYLVTREKMTMKKAKQQAQEEIRKQFYIELSDKTDAEDLDVFGTSKADAALLAISILLQGDRSEPEMMALLTEISNDMAEDGKWNGANADSVKAEIAIWILNNHGKMNDFKNNVKSWGLGDVPPFEKYIEHYTNETLGLPNCTSKKDGYKETVNKKTSPFNKKTFVCNDGIAGLEKTENKFLNPDIKYGTLIDYRDKKVYKTVDIGTQTWMAENLNYYDTTSYPELKSNVSCNKNGCDLYGRYYSWIIAIDSAARFSDNGKGCSSAEYLNNKTCNYQYPLRGICPESWHLPNIDEWYIFGTNIKNQKEALSKEFNGTDIYGFSAIEGTYFWTTPYSGFADYLIGISSAYSNYRTTLIEPRTETYDKYFAPIRCLKNKEIEYGYFIDERDNHRYKTIEIKGMTWMAENLNYRPESNGSTDSTSFCMNNEIEKCEKYGRFYTKESVGNACPNGWHIPDSTEWTSVVAAHAQRTNAMLKIGPYATNVLGFSLLPMGYYNETLYDINPTATVSIWGKEGYFSTYPPSSNMYQENTARFYSTNISGALPLRCVKD